MRSLVSALLLLLQVQPLAGEALCSLLTGGDEDRMEAGCSMREGQVPALDAAWSDPSTIAVSHTAEPGSTGASRECVLSESCLMVTPAVLPPQAALVLAPLPSDFAFPAATLLLSTGSRTPPVPPPNS